MFPIFNLIQNENVNKMINLFLDLLLWVALWEIFYNVVSRYKFSKDERLVVYSVLLVATLCTIYLINGGLAYKCSLYH